MSLLQSYAKDYRRWSPTERFFSIALLLAGLLAVLSEVGTLLAR